MTVRNNSRMHLPFFCKSLSECEYTFGITITVLKISQNNDNRGRHLEYYSHTGIGNWFQCFPVYPGLNLSSGSGSGSGSGSVSGSGSGFRIPDSGFRIPDSGFRIPDSGFLLFHTPPVSDPFSSLSLLAIVLALYTLPKAFFGCKCQCIRKQR